MIRSTPDICRIALEEFNRRHAALKKAARADASDWAGDPANQVAQAWLAIAIAAGVGRDLPRDICAAIEVRAIFPEGRSYLPRADQIMEPHAYLGELARARDVARAKAEGSRDQRLIQRALDLTHLADVLGAPPVETPASFEGRAAA